MDAISSADPTGVLSAASAAVKLVGTVVRVAPQIKGAANRARGVSTSDVHAEVERDVAGITSTGVAPEGLLAATRIDDEAQRRAYEKVNMVLKTLGDRLVRSGLVDIQALARALTQATAHIEVRLFSTETNKLFQSLAQKLNDVSLVNSVFTSIYLLGFLTAELTSSLPGWKDSYMPLSQRIIQQLFKVALGMDGFKENLGANLDAYKTLAVTAGLLKPTDIECTIFRDFPSFSPCRYSSKGFTDRMNNRNTWDKLVKHFEQFGFPQPWQGRDVGMIRDWRFLSSDANSRQYEVEKADKHIGENFGKVLYWLICSANRMPPGMAVIAYYEQHIQLIRWLGPRFGYRIISAATDLNLGGPHAQLQRKQREVLASWVIIMPSITLLAQRQEQFMAEQNPSNGVVQPSPSGIPPSDQQLVSQSAYRPPAPSVQSMPSVPSPTNGSAAVPSPNHPSQMTAAQRMSLYQKTGSALPNPSTNSTSAQAQPPAQSPTSAHSPTPASAPTPAIAPASTTAASPQPGPQVAAQHTSIPTSPISSLPPAAQNTISNTPSTQTQSYQSQQNHPVPSHSASLGTPSEHPTSSIPPSESTHTLETPMIPSAAELEYKMSATAGPDSPSSSFSGPARPTMQAAVPHTHSVSSRPSAGPPSRHSSTTSSSQIQYSTIPMRKPSVASVNSPARPSIPGSVELPAQPAQRPQSMIHPGMQYQHPPQGFLYPHQVPQMIAVPPPGAVELPGSMVLPPHAIKPHHMQMNPSHLHQAHLAQSLGQVSVPGHSTVQPSPAPAARPRRKAPPPPRVVLATALYDFEPDGEDEEEFPFRAGDVLEIIERNKTLSEDGWCRARIKGTQRTGLAPIEYLEEIPNQKPPPPRPQAPPVSASAMAPISPSEMMPPGGYHPAQVQQQQYQPQQFAPNPNVQNQMSPQQTTQYHMNHSLSSHSQSGQASTTVQNVMTQPQPVSNTAPTTINIGQQQSPATMPPMPAPAQATSPAHVTSPALAAVSPPYQSPQSSQTHGGSNPLPGKPVAPQTQQHASQNPNYYAETAGMPGMPSQVPYAPAGGFQQMQYMQHVQHVQPGPHYQQLPQSMMHPSAHETLESSAGPGVDPNIKLSAGAHIIGATLPAVATLGAAAMDMSAKNNATEAKENSNGNANNNSNSRSSHNNDDNDNGYNNSSSNTTQQQANADDHSNSNVTNVYNTDNSNNQAYSSADTYNQQTQQNNTQYNQQTNQQNNQQYSQQYDQQYDQRNNQYNAQQPIYYDTYAQQPSSADSIALSAGTDLATSTLAPAVDQAVLTNTDPTTGILSSYPTTTDVSLTDTTTPLSPLSSLAPTASLDATTAADASLSPLACLAPAAATTDASYFSTDSTSVVDSSAVSPLAGMASDQSMMISETTTTTTETDVAGYGGYVGGGYEGGVVDQSTYTETDTAFLGSSGGAGVFSSFAAEDDYSGF